MNYAKMGFGGLGFRMKSEKTSSFEPSMAMSKITKQHSLGILLYLDQAPMLVCTTRPPTSLSSVAPQQEP
jgi:hypothetical protein